MIKLGFERSGGYATEQIAILDRTLPFAANGYLEFVEEFERGVTGNVVSVGNDTGVKTLGCVPVGLS
jgi:hypothetical protein